MTRSANTIDLLTRRSPRTARQTWNPETREFEAVVSSFAPVERRAMGFTEELSRSSRDWPQDPDRVIPFLLNHDQFNPDSRIGVVQSIRVDQDAVRARIRLGRGPAAQRIAQDLEDNIPIPISFGYRARSMDRIAGERPGDLERRVMRGIEVLEISAVNLAADGSAHARSHPSSQRTTTMDPDDLEEGVDDAFEDQYDDPPRQQRSQRSGSATRRRSAPTQGRRAASRDPEPQHQPAANTGYERGAAARVFGLSEDFCRRHGELDDQQYREAVLAEVQRRSGPPIFPHVEVLGGGYADPATRTRAMGEALLSRLRPSHQPSEAAREFVGLTIPELARRSLEYAGEHTVAMGPSALVTRALHTTSDFPAILGNTIERTLRMAYESAPSPLRQLARQRNAPDFRERHAVQLSTGPTLEKVNEAGEFRGGTFEESRARYKVETFGRIFGISRQALINDDLNAFDTIPQRLGQAAMNFEAQSLADLIVANPQMDDNNAVFSAPHGNLTTPGSFLSVSSLSAARLEMRRQTGLAGELIAATPRWLLVPADLETRGEQVLHDLMATRVDDTNPFAGRLDLVVEPRLPEQQWYVVADPAQVDGLEWAYLEGFEGPQIETQAGFEVDGVRIRVRLDWGAGWIDWRSWHRNDGAEPPTE